VRVREEIWHREDMLGTIARLRPIPDSLGEDNVRKARSPEGLSLPDWGPPMSLLWRTGPMALVDDGTPPSEQAERLQRLRPDYLSANPSALRILLGHCRDAGITLPNLRAVWTLSEVVDSDLRALCQDVFGVRIVHNYSAAECGYIALQCPEHPHFHVQSELALVEVLDADDRPCGSGEIGRVIVTPLHNFAMPLLRYEIGDEAEVGEPCPCGRGLPVLANVIGRLDDYVTLPNGDKRRNYASHYRLARIPALREFQIVQRSLELIEARLVVARPLTADEEQRVRTVLVAAFGDTFRIELAYCESIPRTAAGKLRTFVSELPRD
jgi:phenylacetate-CoA ligase